MVPGIVRRLAELVDHPFLGGVGGIPHPQIDHVDPLATLPVLQFVDPAEEIRRQASDPGSDREIVMLDRLMLLGFGIRSRIDHAESLRLPPGRSLDSD